ncbi:hypothetical protein [Raineyella fluvialis]|uniref:Uncharacterized protein n=1 Tax=Raineyella fluvialis TaxID=2662261 RepID=A0A5Q2FAK2_9ACTN|nr:hypothetical protein [Raineyella fluvialis]QGF24000.1 hypothetical protein Rai3103_10270 [Raineyella fluvialis]
MVPTSPSAGAEWSPTAYQELVRSGRQFAEQVLIHLERLAALQPSSDPRDLEDANIRLEGALLDFQDAQTAYCGRGFEFLPDGSDGPSAAGGPSSGGPGAAGPPEPEASSTSVTRGEVISVMTRHDFELVDQSAVEETAQQFASIAGATPVPPGDLGYAMAILNYMGLGQLTTTPGLRPLLEVNAVSSRTVSPSRREVDAADGVDDLFEPGEVLNYQTNFWEPGQEPPR